MRGKLKATFIKDKMRNSSKIIFQKEAHKYNIEKKVIIVEYRQFKKMKKNFLENLV